MMPGLSLRWRLATAAVVVAPRLVHGGAFDNVLLLIVQAKEEVTKLAEDFDSTYAEIASLVEQFARCEEGRGQAKNESSDDLDGKMHRYEAGDGEDYNYGWTPKVGDSWNYDLLAPVETSINADVILIEVVDGAQDTIGTVENWRGDAARFPTSVIENDAVGCLGEKWLDITSPTVKDVDTLRVEKAATMNCDAIEPGNMMVYTENDTGVEVSEQEQIAYNSWFAETVRAHGMKVGMKNAVELVPMLSNHFDFAVHEQCRQHECDVHADTFVAEGNPVFNIEYGDDRGMRDAPNKNEMDTILKNRDLGAPFCSCSDSSRDF